jgi:hypothetical protein
MARFEYVSHLVTVPVQAGGRQARFVLDTGIGVTLLSRSLATAAGCAADGSVYTGKRMSGQQVSIPLGTLSSLSVAGCPTEDHQVGILDMGQMAGLDGIDGFLSLNAFLTTPFTVDYPAGLLVIEDAVSLASRAAAGVAVDVQVERQGCATDINVALDVPGCGPVMAEVDMGSDALILNEPLAAKMGIDLGGENVRTVSGQDETGGRYDRYFTTLPGTVSLAAAPAIRQANPEVMFQKIIYDGLVGNAFLRNFVVSYDLPAARMIFALPR